MANMDPVMGPILTIMIPCPGVAILKMIPCSAARPRTEKHMSAPRGFCVIQGCVRRRPGANADVMSCWEGCTRPQKRQCMQEVAVRLL